jgi:HAD superfamily hydrolase (TIGR01509 family)
VPPAAILDVDGTLVDTNYHHALAWYRAFRRHGIVLPLWRIHRHIGMGGDQLVGALAGDALDAEHGDDIRASEKDFYGELIGEIQPLSGARELIVELKRRGSTVVLASSAKQDELATYVDLLGARELADAWTSSADVEETKPEPDLIHAALAKAGGESAVMVGDTTWDCKAAAKADVRTIAVLTGGFAEWELREAGAVAVFDSVDDLRRRLDETPFG